MNINAKDLKTIQTDLARRRQARLAAADDRNLSAKEIIKRLAPELRRMKRQGFTTAEMVAALKEHGLHLKGATLNRYLSEGQTPKATSATGRHQNKAASPEGDQTAAADNSAEPLPADSDDTRS